MLGGIPIAKVAGHASAMSATIIPFPIRPAAVGSAADYAREVRKLHPDWETNKVEGVAEVCAFIEERLAARGIKVGRT